MDATTTTLARMMSGNDNNVYYEPTRRSTRSTSYLSYYLKAILKLIIKLLLLWLSTAIAAVAFFKLAKRSSPFLSKLWVSLLHRCGPMYLFFHFIIIFLVLSFRYHKPLSGNNTNTSSATLSSPPPTTTITTAHFHPDELLDRDEERIIHVDPNSLLIEEFIRYNVTRHELFHSSSTEEEEREGLPPPEEQFSTVETETTENGIDGGGDLEATWRTISGLRQAPERENGIDDGDGDLEAESSILGQAPEQENGIDGGGDLETMWMAISYSGQAPPAAMATAAAAAAEQVVRESIPVPSAPPLKKLQTMNVPPAAAAAAAAARVRDFGVLDECKRELRKSETFIMTTVEERRRRGRGGEIMREFNAVASHDKLTQRVEAFISKFQNQLRIQRQESDQRFLEMINRGR